MKTSNCNSCKFFDHNDNSCKRYPPILTFFRLNGKFEPCTAFPIVTPEQWCGEFKEIER